MSTAKMNPLYSILVMIFSNLHPRPDIGETGDNDLILLNLVAFRHNTWRGVCVSRSNFMICGCNVPPFYELAVLNISGNSFRLVAGVIFGI
jgi:hypothetical protein